MLTPEELRTIQADFLPPGYEVRVEDLEGDLGGIGYDNVIFLANPISDEPTLATFLHECAHYYLEHHLDEFQNAPANLREYECEVWMLDKLIERGVYYEGAFQEAQRVVRNRIVQDIMEPTNRDGWKGIFWPAYDFLTQEQRTEVESYYGPIIERGMFQSHRSELKKWYEGEHSEQIPSMLSRVKRRLAL